MPKQAHQSKDQTGGRDALAVLVYNDDDSYRKLIHTILDQSHKVAFNVTEVRNSRQMTMALKRRTPDVIILDLELKGKSGMEWLLEIRDRDIAPVVIITGHGDEQVAVEAMKSGAYDYIPQAYLTYDQMCKSLVYAREKWNLLKEKERLQKELAHMAMYDALTDILSRRALLEQVEVERQRTKRYKRDLSLLMIDIDHFKKVNDTYGHLVGDVVLREVAQTLKKQTRRSDYVGRYGGEEFLIILPETSLDKALVLAEKLRKGVAELTITANDHILKGITVSIGTAAYEDDPSVDEFISRSDKWLYAAKKNGRNQVQPQPNSKN